jgi:hypothetical protein
MNRYQFVLCVFIFMSSWAHGQENIRKEIMLNEGWASVVHNDSTAYTAFKEESYNDKNWTHVEVPHNWDAYEGYRRLKHGNRHGYAWYRKTFTVKAFSGKRYFLWFEGVGSYATVWVNGKWAGYHAGGRTSFTLDITEAIHNNGKPNVLAVRADHPASIDDLPWVCGGCSEEVGFSEGSQPFGIFRPVHLIITEEVRIEPFGVHIWNDTTVSEKSAVLNIATSIKNYSDKDRNIAVVNRIVDKDGKTVVELREEKILQEHGSLTIKRQTPVLLNPRLWSLEEPYLYTVVSEVIEKNKTLDRTSVQYGIRWIKWDINEGGSNQFFLNGKPTFINGTAEYEHLMGQSHAFSDAQVRARAMQVKAAGYNAFRDAHQPHNLRYQQHWDSLGILLWTQHTAHIWFDTPAFRNNFKTLLREWVIERRNNPSVVLWGLQNESQLPEDFARECTELVRELDPTASQQRNVTTCNGGKGTDWDVPQNWTGTYGGDPLTYNDDIKRQVLVGEYGAWRSIDLHTEKMAREQHQYSEEHMSALMETKIRLAESVRDQCSGHFHWLLTSHENPGRVQGGEGLRELDRIGPVNYKGLFTAWGEPVDAYYMFRANYVRAEKDPMVYIVSHTWPDRWTSPGVKNGIQIYSNCDEVELFNDVKAISLGRKSHPGKGRHYQWDGVYIGYNLLYAVGYVKGKAVAADYIVLNHLPQSPQVESLANSKEIVKANKDLHYIYRVNCGGPSYVDQEGNTWQADVQKTQENSWGSTSWTNDFNDLPPYYGSQRTTHDPISNSREWKLFQTFRYGRDKLAFEFPVPDGEYTIELYFSEPWYGTGGSLDCKRWRLFDIAVNDQVVIRDLDIWKEAGHDRALRKVITKEVKGGKLSISFPRVASGQAVIAAIAIASSKRNITAAPASPSLIGKLKMANTISGKWSASSWMDTGDKQYTDDDLVFSKLPSNLFGAEYIRTPSSAAVSQAKVLAEFTLSQEADVFVAFHKNKNSLPGWLLEYEDVKTVLKSGEDTFHIFRKRFPENAEVMLGSNGMRSKMYTVAVTPATVLEPAIDLRPVTTYTPETARLTGKGILKDTMDNRSCIVFSNEGGTLEWSMALGVADKYALRFRYKNQTTVPLQGVLEILTEDGTSMMKEVLRFNPTPVNKWKNYETTTNTMINAGNYRVRVTSAAGQGGLIIRSFDVQ